MPTTYTPNASNDPATYTLPSDLDNATAESVNVAFRALADKAAHAYSVFAQLAAPVNTFTGQIKVNTPTATDHAFEVLGSGRWRPLLVAHCGFTYLGEETELRYYVNDPTAGGGAYFGAITCNAVYDTVWKQQSNFLPSTAILFKSTGVDFSFMPSGSADWASWPQGAGDIHCSYLYPTNDIQWAANKTRTMYLTPAQAQGAGGIETGNGDLVTSSGSFAWWRIQLPVGASVTRVDIKHSQSVATGDRFDLATRNPNFSAPTSAPSWSLIPGSSAATDSSTGYKVSSIVHTEIVSASTELYLLWRPIDNACQFSSAKVTWSEGGPGREY